MDHPAPRTHGVTADQLEVRLPTVALGEVAAEPIEPCRGCVDVGILKRREQHLAVKLDDLRPRSDQWPDVCIRSDRHDVAGPHGDGLRPAPGGVHRIRAAADESNLGVETVGRHFPFLCLVSQHQDLTPPGESRSVEDHEQREADRARRSAWCSRSVGS